MKITDEMVVAYKLAFSEELERLLKDKCDGPGIGFEASRKGIEAALSAAPKHKPAAALETGEVGYARVLIDTRPDQDGWCFCTPPSHPEDIERYGHAVWAYKDQFYGQVFPASYINQPAEDTP